MHKLPPFCSFLPPPSISVICVSTEHRAELPVRHRSLPLAICFTHGSVNIPNFPIHHILPSPGPCLHVLSLYLCFISCRSSPVPFFCLYIYVLGYKSFFSPSGLLHSVWQILIHVSTDDPFCSFLWLSNIPFYVCTTSSLSIHLSMDTRLPPSPGYCNSAAMNTGVHASFWIMVSQGVCPLVALLDHIIVLLLVF